MHTLKRKRTHPDSRATVEHSVHLNFH